MRAVTSGFMVTVRPHSREVSPGHLLVASSPILPPRPLMGEAKSTMVGRPWGDAVSAWSRHAERWDEDSIARGLRALAAADRALKDAGATDAAYGLDKPFALVALNRQPILRVGGLVPGSKDRYARIERQPGEVFVVAAADVELLARSADDYAKPPRDPVPPAMTETPKP